MFAQLIESRPLRHRSPTGVAASLVLHGIIVAGAIIATSHAARPRSPHAPQAVLPVFTQVPEPPRVPPAPLPPATTPMPVGASIISVPLDVPDFIPAVTPLRALINTDQPMVFRIGVPTQPGVPAPNALVTTGVLFADQVEIPVTLEKRSPLPRFPQMLKNAGVEGMARLGFVVDTLGRVELETIQVLESTHPAFAVAVQATLPRMRFTPARVSGRAVRQLVEFPVQFHLDR